MSLSVPFRRMTHMVRASLPIMIGLFADMSINMTDTIMVGRLGDSYLASLGAANALFMICMMFVFGVGGMAGAFLSQAVAQNNQQHTQSTVHGVVATTILVTIVTLLLMVDPRGLLHFTGQPDAIIDGAADYLEIRRWSLVFVCFVVVYRGFLSTIGLQHYITYVSVATLLLNIVLNYMLIYGNFGMPALGISGAAYASNIVVTIGFIVVYVLFRRQKKIPPVHGFKGLLSTPLSAITHTLKIALPVSIAMAVEMIFWSGNSMMAGWLGVDALAAHQTLGSIAAMNLAPIIAFHIMMTIQSGQYAGQKDKNSLGDLPLLGVLFMVGYGVVLFVITLGVVPLLAPHVFALSETVLATLLSGMFLLALNQCVYGLYFAINGILRGLNDTYCMLFISIVTFVILGLSTGYVLGHVLGYGIMGQWVGMNITTGITVVAFYVRLRWLHARSEKLFSKVRYAEN